MLILEKICIFAAQIHNYYGDKHIKYDKAILCHTAYKESMAVRFLLKRRGKGG